MAEGMISGIISLTVGAVILASVFISTIKAQNTSYNCYNGSGALVTCTWTTAEIAMWSLLTLIGIVGLLYGTLRVFGLA